MKPFKLLLFPILLTTLLSCSNESDLKITGITVNIDNQYSRVAQNLLGKNMQVVFYDESANVTIQGQAPLFFTINENHPAGYEYSDLSSGTHINYWMHVKRTLGFVTAIKIQSAEFIGDPEIARKSTGFAYMEMNDLEVDITAKP